MTLHVYHHFVNENELMKKIFDNTNIIKSQNQKVMATLAELSAKVDELQATVDTEQEQIAAAVAALNQTIADLQAIIDQGGNNSAEIQAIMDKVDGIKTDLAGTIPDAG